MDSNVKSAYLTMKCAIPHMLHQGSGSIVNIGSVASFVAFPRDAIYCASKGALLMLTRQVALEYAAAGIRANVICPGFVDTPMMRAHVSRQADPEATVAATRLLHPMGRIGTVADIVGAAVFLASDESAWVTGIALPVDGGLLSQ